MIEASVRVAPILAVSRIVTTMKVAPNAPPVQTHHGEPPRSTLTGAGCREAAATSNSNSNPTTNCAAAAQIGPPSRKPSRALMTDCAATPAPVKNASSKKKLFTGAPRNGA
jgi:hypothetical protein